MPFNPSVTDRSGEIYAAGIMSAANSISRGIHDYRAEKQKRDEEEAAVQWITSNGSKLGLNVTDPKEVKAVIKTAGGGREAVQMLAGMAQLQDQKEAQKREEEKQRRNAAALQTALSGQGGVSVIPSTMQGGRTPGAMIQRYTGMGGELTPDVARMLLGAADKPTQPMPGSMGYRTSEIPGLGTVVMDSATGEPLDGGKIVKPKPTGGASGPVFSADGNFYRSGEGDEWKPAPGRKPPISSAGPEFTKDKKFYRSSEEDEWKPAPGASHTRDAADVTFDSNLDVALQKLDEFDKTVKGFGNFETAQLGNASAKSKLDQLPYQLAILTAKIVDPSSVAREGEVAAAQKYLIPAGFFTTNETTLAAINNLRDTFKQYKTARATAKGSTGDSGQADALESDATPEGRNEMADLFTDTDGAKYRIKTIRGQRGIMKGGKFYPIIEE